MEGLNINNITGNSYCPKASYGAIWLCMAVLFIILSFNTPIIIDDYMFMSIWRDKTGGDEFSFSGMASFYEYIRATDNGRIANILAPFTTVFTPYRYIFPFFNGIMAAFTVWMCAALAYNKTNLRGCLALALTWGASLLFLPWFDGIMVADFALNYIWAAAVNLVFIALLLKLSRIGKSGSLFILSLLAAVIAGGWHEGFSVPTACGISLYLLSKKFKAPATFYTCFAVYIISALIFMLSPGIIGRAGYAMEAGHHIPSLRYIIGIVCLVLFMGACCLSKRGRDALKDVWLTPVFIIGAGIILAGTGIACITVNTARSYFWPELWAIILIILIFSRLPIIQKKAWSITLTGLAALLCIAEMSIVIHWERKYKLETEKIVELIENSDSGTAYYKLEQPFKTPRYTLFMPLSGIWYNQWQYRVLSWYYGKPVISVVPAALKNASYSAGKTVAGSDSIRIIDGFLIMPYSNQDPYENLIIPGPKTIRAKLRDNTVREANFLAQPFISGQDTLLYLDIHDFNISEITEVDTLYSRKVDPFPYMYHH